MTSLICVVPVVGDAVEKDIMNPRKDSSELRMSSSPRGICLIISNEIFDPLQNKKDADSSKIAPEYLANNKPSSKDRPGTLVDERSLEDTFKWLGFKVRTERNCKADQMYEILKKVSEEDHKEYDAFVCCILTHGTKGQVFGTDWESLEIVKIRGLFEDHVCKSLGGKPKIFLIQACRGDDTDLGYYESIPVEKSERISCPAEGNETFDEFDDGEFQPIILHWLIFNLSRVEGVQKYHHPFRTFKVCHFQTQEECSCKFTLSYFLSSFSIFWRNILLVWHCIAPLSPKQGMAKFL